LTSASVRHHRRHPERTPFPSNRSLSSSRSSSSSSVVVVTIGGTDYDFTPVIFTVTGERLANGDTLLTIIGRGFGFHASDLVISAVDYNQDTPDADCYVLNPSDASQYPQTISCPGRPSIIHYPPTALLPNYSYPCTHTRIFHHDSHISCTVSIPNAVPSELTVIVNTPNGKSASQSLLSEYIQ